VVLPEEVSPNGTTTALSKVSIRARVRGVLKEQHFQEVGDVTASQLLFVIEEDPFQAELDKAKAQHAITEAALEQAKLSKTREVATAQLAFDTAQ